MTKASQTPDIKNFYRLPFEKGTFELTEQTLNLHSEFRKPHYFFRIDLRKINYHNEFLTLGIRLREEPEQQVHIKVEREELLVCCSAGTNSTHLSRYAYFALLDQMSYGGSVDFEKYYWPDFFDPLTGRSKYLQIINDRRGLDIELKPKFPTFYRPGEELIQIPAETTGVRIPLPKSFPQEDLSSTSYTIGYFLSSYRLSSIHSDHFPFLTPFLGTLTKDKKGIKSYTSFLLSESDLQLLTYSSRQDHLNEICYRMREMAPIRSKNNRKANRFEEDEIERGRLLIELWHQSMELVLPQRHVYYYGAYGLKYFQGKPKRRWTDTTCEIKHETPRLLLKKIDKGDYYHLELLFIANGKIYYPESHIIPFFISDRNDPMKLYLLNDFSDFLLLDFFQRKKFQLAVLKCHYKDEIKDLVDLLAKRYELKES